MMAREQLPRSWLGGVAHVTEVPTHFEQERTTHEKERIMTPVEPLNDDVEICADCYHNHHNGLAMADGSVGWTDNTDSNNEDGDTGITDFSWSRCECCGSTLGGSRFRMAIWALPESQDGTK